MEIKSNFKSYLIKKYGSSQKGKKIILARRKKYHSIIYNAYLEWFYRTQPFQGFLTESEYHTLAAKSWQSLKLIQRLAT